MTAVTSIEPASGPAGQRRTDDQPGGTLGDRQPSRAV